MQVRFWGTRGSIAKPGSGTVRYGGNTACVEVRSASGTLVVLDCGTGAHALGQALSASGEAVRGHLLITHTHWDHIQGLPFFLPLFVPGSEWDVYAPRGLSHSLQETLAGQMQYTYFPVELAQLGATIRYHDLVEGAFPAGDIGVTARYMNHTALTLGYRLQADGASVVYATDHEPHAPLTGQRPLNLDAEDRRHAEFVRGADLLIHDAQYTLDEFPAKSGWGHSPVEYVVALAQHAGVRRLALYHHDPLRDDDAVDAVVAGARRLTASLRATVEVFAAAEGREVLLRGEAAPRPAPTAVPAAPSTAKADVSPTVAQQPVLIAVADPETLLPLAEAVGADGVRVITAGDAASALTLAREEHPAVAVVDAALPGAEPLALARGLVEGTAPGEAPRVIVVVSPSDPRPSAREVSDWLVRPFSIGYARTRIRAWLLRTACRWRPAALPADEEHRLAALRTLEVLDTPAEERFDRLTRLAAALFDVPVALVSLVDRDRQWFKSAHGLTARQTPRDMAFCAYAILDDEIFVVPDALLDPRFADNPLVTTEPRVRFYAGVPLTIEPGQRVGTLCLIDHRPRQLNERDIRVLRELGTQVQEELKARAPRPRRRPARG